MPLAESLNQDLTQALKAKEALKIEVLRMLMASLKNEQINNKKEKLSDEEVLKILKREAKKREESIKAYTQGGRDELADKEKQELEILQKYLPEQLSEEDILKKIKTIKEKTGLDQFGPLMGKVMSELGAQADGSLVQKLLKQELEK